MSEPQIIPDRDDFRFLFNPELFTGYHTPPEKSYRIAIRYRGGRVRSASMMIKKIILIPVSTLILDNIFAFSISYLKDW